MSEVLSKDAFVTAMTPDLPEEVVEGCRVRALPAAAYQRLQAVRTQAMLGANDAERVAVSQAAETMAWLSMGVVEPVLPPDEWKALLERGQAQKVQAIIGAIKRLTGADQVELEAAKKALGLTLAEPAS